MEAGLSLLGASGNFTTAAMVARYGAASSSAITIGATAAFVGGYELGRAFNQAWAYFTDGQSSFGTWWYDSTHSDP